MALWSVETLSVVANTHTRSNSFGNTAMSWPDCAALSCRMESALTMALTRRPVAVRFARRCFASDITASVREGVPLWDAYLSSVAASGCCRYENATSSKPRSCSSLQRLTRYVRMNVLYGSTQPPEPSVYALPDAVCSAVAA